LSQVDDEEDEEWNNNQDWNEENDETEEFREESSAYLDFLQDEVSGARRCDDFS
jgi:hypothetical protein